MSRLFFALWPDADTRAAMAAIMARLPQGCGRCVANGNLHITLAFLGSVKEKQTRCVLDGAGNIKVKPVTLTLDKLGWWQRPQVIWLGSQTTPEALILLADALKVVAGQCGIRTDERPFAAHATLARKVKRQVVLPDIAPITWQIRDICLVRSETLPEGAKYEVVWTSTG